MTGAILHHSAAPPPDDRPHDRLLVVTWNIEFARQTHRAIKAIESHEEVSRADVVLLQEMDERGTAEIADHLDLNYAYVALSVHPQSDRNFGNAVLAPWPLGDVEVVPLPHRAAVQGQPRAALAVTVGHPGADIRAISVHTETPVLSHRKRLRQFVTLGELADRWRHLPVLLGGDCNTASSRSLSAIDGELARHGLDRASRGVGPTLRRARRRFELDHLYVAGLTVQRAGRVEDHGASDHDAVWAELSPKGPVSDGTTGAPG